MTTHTPAVHSCKRPRRQWTLRVAMLGLAVVSLVSCSAVPPRPAKDTGQTLGGKTIDRFSRPTPDFLPSCVTIKGKCIALDEGYIAGVVQCEVAGISDAGAALEAQAIAARTYFASWYLRTKGKKNVDTTARFQCWRPPTSERAKNAAISTAGIVMQLDSRPIYANYVSGTKLLGFDCMPASPRASGYAYDTWGEMQAIYRERRAKRSRQRFRGTDWTELFVTRNEGRTAKALDRTVMSAQNKLNRGALAQRTAICLAENLGYETEQILKYFYGDDLRLSAPIPRLDAVN